MKTEMKKLTAALEVIANVFVETYEYTDNHGVTEIRNRYGFIQDSVLNGIAYQLARSLDYTVNTTLPRAMAIARKAKRELDGGEIGSTQYEKATDWVENLLGQIEYTEAALAIASDTYTSATGKPFHFLAKGRNVPDAKPEQMTDAEKRFAHLEAQAKSKMAG